MGYAKSLGKKYNADSAWSSLGTDRSAYEQSRLRNTLANFREISIPGFSEYSTSGPRRSSPYDQNLMYNTSAQYTNPQIFINSLFNGINAYPDAAFSAGLAGKYSSIV